MSGFGVNVTKLMEAAGWTMGKFSPKPGPDEDSNGTLTGLVLIG